MTHAAKVHTMPPVPTELPDGRHTRLFELIRQQNLSEVTAARLRARRFARDRLDREEAATLQALAVQSWGAAAHTD